MVKLPSLNQTFEVDDMEIDLVKKVITKTAN